MQPIYLNRIAFSKTQHCEKQMCGISVRAGSNANETLAVCCQIQPVPLCRRVDIGFPANIAHPPLVHHANTVPVTTQNPFGNFHLLFLHFLRVSLAFHI